MLNIQRSLAIATGLLLCGPSGSLWAQLSPGDSLASLQAEYGLQVSLWASEPMVNNPTGMDIDSRGRVWITEGLNYRMQQRPLDTLKRIEDADRVKILEDTDGDGKADKVTVFADKIFPVPQGLAVEEIWKDGQQVGTRVYIGNSPDLLVLEDTDGDDRADRRNPLLTGFRGVDSDHGLHGMILGLDGKLYFTVGDARYGADGVQGREATFDVTDKSGRQLKADNFGTTLRVNRDGTQLEVLSSGHRNNYEAAIDSFARVYASDNDDDGNRGCRMVWIMNGGKYGYQHPKSTRHWAEEIPGIIPKLVGTGNGAPAGLAVYEGNLLPQEMRGAVLQVDAGTHQVNLHPIQRYGGGLRSEYKVLLKGTDDWFRPVDVSVAGDGSIFVCDWYDAGVGGNRFTDQTTGRIYRLHSPGQSSASRPADRQSVDDNLISALKSPNRCAQIAARDILVQAGNASRPKLQKLFREGTRLERARALHVLAALSQTGQPDLITALRDQDPSIRELAVRLLASDARAEFLVEAKNELLFEPPAAAFLDQLRRLTGDEDAGVRRELLMAIRRVSTELVEPMLIELVEAWDGQDRYYLEAIRAALVNRESELVRRVFDRLAQKLVVNNTTVEIPSPPFYPIQSNDAFIPIGDASATATPSSKLIGIAWALQRSEALSALNVVTTANRTLPICMATCEALAAIPDPHAGELMMGYYNLFAGNPDLNRLILKKLTTKLNGDWQSLRSNEQVRFIIRQGLLDKAVLPYIARTIADLQLDEFTGQLRYIVNDTMAESSARTSALLALARLKNKDAAVELARIFIRMSSGQPSGDDVTLTSVDVLSLANHEEESAAIVVTSDYPLDVRRRALQVTCNRLEGAKELVKLAKDYKLPKELQSELAFTLVNHADGRVRGLAKAELNLESLTGSSKIHEYQSIMPLAGDKQRGKEIFANNPNAMCARCHRVEGQEPLIGPNLSTIGTKYGARELLYHIQSPSGAINYSYAARTFLLDDGKVLNGLVLKRDESKVTLGLSNGQQSTIDVDSIEEEKAMATSIMPEGLIANLSPQQVADLLEYLQGLRQSSPK